MLPRFRAISFNQIIDKGGRTRPWSVLVDTPGGVRPFVVKMFTPQLINARDSVTNEVLGNVLASEFDLPAPDAALIEMDENFRSTIGDADAALAYDQADDRLKFGTALIEGNALFNPSFSKAQASKMIELDSLFGFDCLIRNRDRNEGKPNLLVKSRSAYLIDHELGFELDSDTVKDFMAGKWDPDFNRHHIFLNYLKRARKATKIHYFDEFEEHLKRMNVSKLDSFLRQLAQEGFSTHKHSLIIDWLTKAKQNSGTFAGLLKGMIA